MRNPKDIPAIALPTFQYVSHPQKNGGAKQKMAKIFFRLFRRISPSQIRGLHYPCFQNPYGRYGGKTPMEFPYFHDIPLPFPKKNDKIKPVYM